MTPNDARRDPDTMTRHGGAVRELLYLLAWCRRNDRDEDDVLSSARFNARRDEWQLGSGEILRIRTEASDSIEALRPLGMTRDVAMEWVTRNLTEET